MNQLKYSLHLLPHVIAAGLGLQYAWLISQTVYVKSGLQFVAPLLVIMIVHLFWIVVTCGLPAGFSGLVYKRSAQSAVGVTSLILLGAFIAPQPAAAGGSDVLGIALTVIICVAMIAIVVGILAGIGYVLYKTCFAIYKGLSGNNKSGHDSRLFDFGSLAITGVLLCIFSLEGLPNTYSFAPQNQSSASYVIEANSDHVWDVMEQATSPEFPLPGVLAMFPRPVEVVVDEGMALGAVRKVRFEGREGVGHLTLHIVDRTEMGAIFEVQSDTTPFANWVTHRRLIYQATPEGNATRLTVTLEYDRQLAPYWFFTPTIKGIAYLAVDVLARDVKTRAEG